MNNSARSVCGFADVLPGTPLPAAEAQRGHGRRAGLTPAALRCTHKFCSLEVCTVPAGSFCRMVVVHLFAVSGFCGEFFSMLIVFDSVSGSILT